ncbi:MAG: XdhC family protein [Solirubrobacteraceae bacterium]
MSHLAEELGARGEAYVAATVVRVEHPTSVEPGNVALVREDGTIEGFVGGVCAQHSVRLYSLKAIETGEPVLLRILGGDSEDVAAVAEVTAGCELDATEGAITVQNPCLSGGSIEVFLEPFLPAPRVLVAGESPIAVALARIGSEIGLEMVRTEDEPGRVPQDGDLALVVAAHGRGEVEILRAGLEARIEYVGLVASRKRGAAVLDELRAAGVSDELLAGVDSPAGYDIGARSPAEIALSILARIIELRRRGEASAATERRPRPAVATAMDPICGMNVMIGADTPCSERDGEVVYFCCDGCKRSFEDQPAA